MSKVDKVKQLLGLSNSAKVEDLDDHTREIIEEVKQEDKS